MDRSNSDNHSNSLKNLAAPIDAHNITAAHLQQHHQPPPPPPPAQPYQSDLASNPSSPLIIEMNSNDNNNTSTPNVGTHNTTDNTTTTSTSITTNGDIVIPDAAPIEIDGSDEDDDGEEDEDDDEDDEDDDDEDEEDEDEGDEGESKSNITKNVIRPSHVFTPSERIQQLNQVDKDISSLLLHAGLAIDSLSTSTTPSSKQIFTQNTKSYHSLLSSIIVNIRRQMFALEQAGIPVPSIGAGGEQQRSGTGGGGAGTGTGAGGSGSASGSGRRDGGLDVGEINGRSDKVGRVKEAELWKKAREMVEESRRGGSGDNEQRMDLDVSVGV